MSCRYIHELTATIGVSDVFNCPFHKHQSSHCIHPLPLISLHQRKIHNCIWTHAHSIHAYAHNKHMHVRVQRHVGLTVDGRLKVLQTNGALYSPHILLSVSESNDGHRRRDSKGGLFVRTRTKLTRIAAPQGRLWPYLQFHFTRFLVIAERTAKHTVERPGEPLFGRRFPLRFSSAHG